MPGSKHKAAYPERFPLAFYRRLQNARGFFEAKAMGIRSMTGAGQILNRSPYAVLPFVFAAFS
jgi:hypothetical protein